MFSAVRYEDLLHQGPQLMDILYSHMLQGASKNGKGSSKSHKASAGK